MSVLLLPATRRRGVLNMCTQSCSGHCADLPRTGLLVCNLNAHYKIDTPTWIAWTNIVRRSADAVRTAAAVTIADRRKPAGLRL